MKQFLALTLCSLLRLSAFCQPDPIPRTSLSYEALTRFYQSTVTTGDKGGFDFKSTIFGINRLFAGKRLDLSSYYNSRIGMAQRNTELTLGIRKSSKANDYSALNGGFKYAIINNRDKSAVNFFKLQEAQYYELSQVLGKAVQNVASAIEEVDDPIEQAKQRKELKDGFNRFKNSKDLNDLPVSVREAVKPFWPVVLADYDSLLSVFDKKGVLTLSAQSGYDWSVRAAGTTNFLLQYTKGVSKNDKALEIDARLKYLLEKDTTGVRNNLDRGTLSISLGINKVLVQTSEGTPFLEFELAADYSDIVTSALYRGEYKETKNGIVYLRVHVSKQLTIPVAVKFDVAHPNLFGFLQLQWNLESQKAK